MPVAAARPPLATLNSWSASGKGNGRLPRSCGLLCAAPSSWYSTPFRRPPATEMPTLPEVLRAETLPVLTAPPARTMRSVTFRVCSGSSTIRSCSTTSLIPALRTSTSGVAPATVIVSSRLPNAECGVDHRVGVDLQHDTGLHVGAKPWQRDLQPVRADRHVRHGPGSGLVRDNGAGEWVSVCVASTVTPGSTAPLSSVTRPFSCAVA